MREKILPSVPLEQPVRDWKTSHKHSLECDKDSDYEDVILGESNYENIAVGAFEIVEDHIYDRAQVPDRVSPSMIYQMTATDAHVKAVTQIALTQNQKQSPQVYSHNDSSNHKAGGQWRHSDRDPDHNRTTSQKVAMSPTTTQFIPPRDVVRANISPVHNSSGIHDSPGCRPKWKEPMSPPQSGSPAVAPKVHNLSKPPMLPMKTFTHQEPPALPPKEPEPEKFDSPTLSPSTFKAAAPTPPPKTSKLVTSPQKASPLLPPKHAPIPPPKTPKATSESPSLPPKVPKESNSPMLYPKPSKRPPAAPLPPPKPSKQDSPSIHPRFGNSHASFSSQAQFNTKSGFGHGNLGAEVAALAAARQQTSSSKRYYRSS